MELCCIYNKVERRFNFIISKKGKYLKNINFEEKKISLCPDHCDRIVERCIYNKVERRLNFIFQKGRIFKKYKFLRKKISLCLDHCDRIVERCIYNKVERRALILLFAKRENI